MSSSANNFQSPGTTGIRITRRSARNLGGTREASTPTTSVAASKSKGFTIFFRLIVKFSKEIGELANKQSTYIEDEASIKKLTTKREQGLSILYA